MEMSTQLMIMLSLLGAVRDWYSFFSKTQPFTSESTLAISNI